MSPLWFVGTVALFLVTFVTTSPVEVKDDEEKKATDVEKRGGGFDCYIHGRRYRDGEIFSFPGASRCIKYRCNNGGYSVVQGACDRNGRCVAVGSVITDKCRSLRCETRTEGNARYYRLEPTTGDRCEIDGRCVQKYTPFVHTNCATYKCIPTQHGGYNFIPTGAQMCQDNNNRCVSIGSTFAKYVNGRYYRNCVCRGGGAYQCRG